MTYGMNDELYFFYLTYPEQLVVKKVVGLTYDMQLEPDGNGANEKLDLKTDFRAIDDDLYSVFDHINTKAEQRYIEANFDSPATVYGNIKIWLERYSDNPSGLVRNKPLKLLKNRHIWEKLDGKTDLEKVISALKYEVDVQLETLSRNPKSKRHLTLALKLIDKIAEYIVKLGD